MDKDRRQRAIDQLLRSDDLIDSQAALMERLESQMKISATQATISRDLREMGVVRTPTGYMLPERVASSYNGAGSMAKSTLRTLGRAFTRVVDTEVAGTLVVVRTVPGHASAITAEIDAARLDKVVGTIAGEDTIFLATRSTRDAATVAKEIVALYAADEHADREDRR